MASARRKTMGRDVDYRIGDGKPFAETDLHRQIMTELIEILTARYAADPMVYVSGNLLLFYEEGNKRKHISPDVFVVFGVPKQNHDNYLLWAEGRGPDFVIEVTSKSTRKEDESVNRALYRDVLKVREYFQFDPTEDYLHPPLQGFRLVDQDFQAIARVSGRLPSDVLGLHMEHVEGSLRLYDPVRGNWLQTRAAFAEAEADRLRRELEELRQRIANGG